MAYLIQTLGIIGILIYKSVTKGIDAVYNTPLWWVFRLTTTVLLFAAIAMTIEHNLKIRTLKKSLLAGLLSFVVPLIPGLYIQYLLKRKIANELVE